MRLCRDHNEASTDLSHLDEVVLALSPYPHSVQTARATTEPLPLAAWLLGDLSCYK